MRTRHLLVLALATTALGACGTKDDPKTGAEGDRSDKAELAFARCMRGQGIDIPDPNGGSGPQRLKLGRDTSPAKVEAATKSCHTSTGGGPRELTDAEQTKFRDAALKFARCMRSKGVDVPDPEAAGGGIVVRSRKDGATGGPPVDSTKFKAAEKACRSLMPGPPDGGESGGSGLQLDQPRP